MADKFRYTVTEQDVRRIAEQRMKQLGAKSYKIRKWGSGWAISMILPTGKVWIGRVPLTVEAERRELTEKERQTLERQYQLGQAQKGGFVSDTGLYVEQSLNNLATMRADYQKTLNEYLRAREQAYRNVLKGTAFKRREPISDVGLIARRVVRPSGAPGSGLIIQRAIRTPRRVVKEKVSPYAGYESYYQGLYATKSYLGLGLSPEEKEIVREYMKGPDKVAAEVVWAGKSSVGKVRGGRGELIAYKPSLTQKLKSSAKSLWEKSFFGEVSRRMEEARRERLGEYVLGKRGTKSLVSESLASGMYEPIVNPPQFLGKLVLLPVTVPIAVGKYISGKVKGKEEEERKTELERRLRKASLVAGASEAVGSAIGAVSIMPYVDLGLAKMRGWWRTRGLPEVKVEEIVPKEVIEGKQQFPTYPKKLRFAEPTVKVKYLSQRNIPVKQAIEARLGKLTSEHYLGLHATQTEFPEVTKVMLGDSLHPGLYVAPEASPYFLRVKGLTEIYSSTPTSLRGFFGKPLFLRKPTIIGVYAKKPTVWPKTWEGLRIKTPTLFNKWVLHTQSGKPSNILTFESGVLGKTELESIIPPETILTRLSKGVRVNWKGIRIPVRIYRAVENPAVDWRKIAELKQDWLMTQVKLGRMKIHSPPMPTIEKVLKTWKKVTPEGIFTKQKVLMSFKGKTLPKTFTVQFTRAGEMLGKAAPESVGKTLLKQVAKPIKVGESSLGLESVPFGTYALIGAGTSLLSYPKTTPKQLVSTYTQRVSKEKLFEKYYRPIELKYSYIRLPQISYIGSLSKVEPPTIKPTPSGYKPTETRKTYTVVPKRIVIHEATYTPVIEKASISVVTSRLSTLKGYEGGGYSLLSRRSLSSMTLSTPTYYSGPTESTVAEPIKYPRRPEGRKRKVVKVSRGKWHIWVGYQPLLTGFAQVLSIPQKPPVKKTLQKS